MKKFVKIENGVVTYQEMAAQRSHADLVEAPMNVLPGYTYSNGTFSQPQMDVENLIYFLKKYYPAQLVKSVTYNGITIETDEITCNRLNNKIQVLRYKGDNELQTNWRGYDGWHNVDLDTLENLGLLADQVWQNVFDTLKTVEAGILAGTITTTQDIINIFADD